MTIIQGDARHIPLRDESVQTVVTSPPYWGLRDYGIPGQIGLESTPELYVQHIVEVFREVRRGLRKDGTCWVNLGDSYAQNGGHNQTEKELKQEQAKGWFRDERGRYPTRATSSGRAANTAVSGLKPKDLVGIPWRVAFALQQDGWWLRSDIIWNKPNPMPESVTDRPTKSHEYIFLLAKSERYYYDAEAIREPHTRDWSNENGLMGMNTWASDAGRNDCNRTRPPQFNLDGRNKRSVWTVATQPFSGAHFATFPEDLIKPCILAGCPSGGIVLDPFAGSGTTVKVAQDLGRVGIGLELKQDYLKLAKHRSAQQGFVLHF